MAQKYQSMESRTGYAVGEIVELSMDELNRTPFNVDMRLIDALDEKELVESVARESLLKELSDDLVMKGLSPKRRMLVCEKYSSLDELKLHASNAGIDPLTDEWLALNYGIEEHKPKSRAAIVNKSKLKESEL